MRVDGPQATPDARIHHPRPHSGARFGVDDAASGPSSSSTAPSTGLALVSPSAQAALLDWQADAPEGAGASIPGTTPV